MQSDSLRKFHFCTWMRILHGQVDGYALCGITISISKAKAVLLGLSCVTNQNLAKPKRKKIIEIFVVFGVRYFFFFILFFFSFVFLLKTWIFFFLLCQVTLTIVNLHHVFFQSTNFLKFLDKVMCFRYVLSPMIACEQEKSFYLWRNLY